MAQRRDNYITNLADVAAVYQGLTDTPFRNANAVASYLGNYVSLPGKWLASDITRLARASKIEHLHDDSAGTPQKNNTHVRVGNRQVQEMKNRKEHYENLLRTLPASNGGSGPFRKPSSWGDEWFTINEVSAMLGCHSGTIRKLIAGGKLDAEKGEVEPFMLGSDVVVEVTRIHRIKLSQYIARVYHKADKS